MGLRGDYNSVHEPIEFLEKLTALIPRPALNLLVYHGVLAPQARWHPDVVAYGRPAGDAASGRRQCRCRY